MTWQTHAVVGANAVWLAAIVAPVDQTFVGLMAAGALAGLLPDIDATNAKIHYVGGSALGLFKGAFKHRSFFHSILAVLIVYLLCFFFLRRFHPLLPMVVAMGYASHPIIDGFNFPGVRYLFPLPKHYRLVPKFLASPLKGWAETLFFFLALFGIIFFVFSYFDVITADLSSTAFF